jgi:hypothetical protein
MRIINKATMLNTTSLKSSYRTLHIKGTIQDTTRASGIFFVHYYKRIYKHEDELDSIYNNITFNECKRILLEFYLKMEYKEPCNELSIYSKKEEDKESLPIKVTSIRDVYFE